MFPLSPLVNAWAQVEGEAFEQGYLMMIGVGPLVVAALVFWIGVKLQFAGKPKWIKWLAVVPLLVGLYLGIEPMRMFFFDKVYTDVTGGGGRKAFMHAWGVVAAVLGAVGLALWAKLLDRQRYDEL